LFVKCYAEVAAKGAPWSVAFGQMPESCTRTAFLDCPGRLSAPPIAFTGVRQVNHPKDPMVDYQPIRGAKSAFLGLLLAAMGRAQYVLRPLDSGLNSIFLPESKSIAYKL
jgi:hypothetical protein